MHFSIIQILGQWAASNSYWLISIAMLIEGPPVTAAAAFAAANQLLNGYIVFSISIITNIIPDLLYYALGFWGREKFIDRYGHYIGLTAKKVEGIEKMLHKHPGKSLIAIKLVPLLAAPGLFAAGASRMDLKKYAAWTIGITLPSSLGYYLIGYYSGAAYSKIIHYADIGGWIIAGLTILAFLTLYLVRKFNEGWINKMES